MSTPEAETLVQELRHQGITDEAVLRAIAQTPREMFVEQAVSHSAWKNTALPIACGQTISQPYIVALMTQALELNDKMRVLEIGTGSGYQSAILAPLCRRVYSIERHKPLLRTAEVRFNSLRIHNVVGKWGDGYKGWPEQAPFDRIIITAAVPEIPKALLDQLKPDGILVAPIDRGAGLESISQLLTKIINRHNGVTTEHLVPVTFVPMLPGIAQEPQKADGTYR